jgi:hypothetical protein
MRFWTRHSGGDKVNAAASKVPNVRDGKPLIRRILNTIGRIKKEKDEDPRK